MKHRIILQGARFKHHGYYMRHVRFQSTFHQRLGITAPPGASQRQVLEQLSKHALKFTERTYSEPQGSNGVAILASKEFTGWIDDQNFMSAFLGTLFKPTRTTQTNSQSLDVLSGVTDSLGPLRPSSEPRSGFSVLWGPNDRILPGLWGEESFGTDNDRAACVSFVTNPLAGSTGSLEVTLPLANTVFQNGRRSTLHASKWSLTSTGSMALRTKEPKMAQRISVQGNSINRASSRIPILPVTPPRKVVASLGNIVRQVEVDGAVTPASKELEAIIPKIFDERAQRDPNSTPTPMGVWCWVIPPRVMESQRFDNLNLFKAGSSQTEADIALGSMELFSELLSSGCRLHKILSGGGGWGIKQGLLSLDPETTFSLPGKDDDMEMFIESFKQRNSAEATGGLVTPGSYLLFCVEPQMTGTEALMSRLLASTNMFAFGIAPSPDDKPSAGFYSSSVEIIDGHFSASSADGLFLRTMPESVGTPHSSFATKINVPGACLCV